MLNYKFDKHHPAIKGEMLLIKIAVDPKMRMDFFWLCPDLMIVSPSYFETIKDIVKPVTE